MAFGDMTVGSKFGSYDYQHKKSEAETSGSVAYTGIPPASIFDFQRQKQQQQQQSVETGGQVANNGFTLVA